MQGQPSEKQHELVRSIYRSKFYICPLLCEAILSLSGFVWGENCGSVFLLINLLFFAVLCSRAENVSNFVKIDSLLGPVWKFDLILSTKLLTLHLPVFEVFPLLFCFSSHLLNEYDHRPVGCSDGLQNFRNTILCLHIRQFWERACNARSHARYSCFLLCVTF